MSEYALRTLTFQPDGSVSIEYTSPADYKTNGLIVNHVIFVPAGSDYDDELDEVRVAALALLVDALDDLDRVPAIEPPAQRDPNSEDD